jgi:hypothetical protein
MNGTRKVDEEDAGWTPDELGGEEAGGVKETVGLLSRDSISFNGIRGVAAR